jgi:AcrR family transcriptional regulator
VVGQRHPEETRERLLEAALASFAESGYSATGVAEICQRAGVTKGAFYHHFPSKHALFLELLRLWLADLDTQLAAARQGAASVPDQFRRMAALFRQVLQKTDGALPIFFEFMVEAQRDPSVWQATIAPYRRYCAAFAELISQGVAEGSLRTHDPETMGRVVVSLAVGLLLQAQLEPEAVQWGQVAEDGIGLLLRGMCADGG